VDKDKLVLSGGSYGGYLAAWIVGHDKRFKAAVAQRGIYDLATFFGEGSAWRLVPYHFGGYPWQPFVRRLLDSQSPLSHAEHIVTPLLIEHGDNDRRTGTAQSEMLFRALKVLNRPVEYVRYPNATHELSRTGDPAQRIDRLLRFDEFFRRFIGE
jgi:dipeptidyl aminopeptidase/acylaminoacyl peptidase